MAFESDNSDPFDPEMAKIWALDAAAEVFEHSALEDLITLEVAAVMRLPQGYSHDQAIEMVLDSCDHNPELFAKRATALADIAFDTQRAMCANGITYEDAVEDWRNMLAQEPHEVAEWLEAKMPIDDQA